MDIRHGNAVWGVIALIEASGGRIEGRIRVQKEAFLLALKGISYFRTRSFGYHYYGPYSREISDAIQNAVASGFVKETREFFQEGQKRYTYEISPEGKQWLDARRDSMDHAIGPALETLKDKNWRALELAATIAFLQAHSEHQDQGAALDQALHLKPECGAFKQEAVEILKALQI